MEYIFPTIPQKRLKENKRHIYDYLDKPKIGNTYDSLNIDTSKSIAQPTATNIKSVGLDKTKKFNDYDEHKLDAVLKLATPITRNEQFNDLRVINRKKIISIICFIGLLLIAGLIVLILFFTSMHILFLIQTTYWEELLKISKRIILYARGRAGESRFYYHS